MAVPSRAKRVTTCKASAASHVRKGGERNEARARERVVFYLASARADGGRRRFDEAGLAHVYSAVAAAHDAANVVRGVVQRRFNLHCQRQKPVAFIK